MKRQAIPICLDDLKELEKQIKKEISDIGLRISYKNNRRVGVLIPIVNYPTKKGKGIIYCSDTWKFENIKLKKVLK